MPTAEERIIQLEAALNDERVRRSTADELARADAAARVRELSAMRAECDEARREAEARKEELRLRDELLGQKDATLVAREEQVRMLKAQIEALHPGAVPAASGHGPCQDGSKHHGTKAEDMVLTGKLSTSDTPPKKEVQDREVIEISDSDDPGKDVKPSRLSRNTPRLKQTKPEDPDIKKQAQDCGKGIQTCSQLKRRRSSASPPAQSDDRRSTQWPRLNGPETTSQHSTRRPPNISCLPRSLEARTSAIPSVDAPNVEPITSGRDHPGYVSRRFLSKVYRFSERELLHRPKPDADSVTFQRKNVLFPPWVQNPRLPLEPGRPGTLLALRDDILEVRKFSLFICAPVKAVWLYMGEYGLTVCPTPLSSKEFRGLHKSTRLSWAKTILKRQKWDCFMSARARIKLRKDGQALTDATVSAEVKLSRGDRGKFHGLSEQDILDAFDAGQETLQVYLLHPQSYDTKFAEHMLSNWKNWEAELESVSKSRPQTEAAESEQDQLTDEDEDSP
ncbi:hypothetical protein BC834DRAFT_270009 [Gloeopeniophorella convolvens]|nr:hypothetical protein BC834DRAFT_270009 [Gloeopeniophorella convolvens]